MTSKAFTLSLLSIAATVQALPNNGLWTGYDWEHKKSGYKFTNGVIGSDDPLIRRKLAAPLACAESKMSDYGTKANVVRVASILPESKYDELFPIRDSFYSYANFLKAVGKFPAFCNEFNADYSGHKTNAENIDMTCKRELSTLFAHIAYQSGKMDPWDPTTGNNQYKQGLYRKADNCAGGSDCNEHVDSPKYPATTGKSYHGRGPLFITGNKGYGAFSDAFGPLSYDSKSKFLDNPDLLETDGYISWSSAIWFYMTPNFTKPSMHDIMTNFWEPNDADKGANLNIGFGATTEIINGDSECGTGGTSTGEANRYVFFQQFLGEFGLHGGDVAAMGCGNYWSGFPHAGSHFQMPQYFVEKWGDTNRCNIVTYETPYNVYVEGDYKRCVCDKFGEGAATCLGGGNDDQDDNDDQDNDDQDNDDQDNDDQDNDDQDNDDQDNDDQDDQDDKDDDDGKDDNDDQDQDDDQNDNDDQDDDKDDGTELNLDNEVSRMFEEIWKNMHYDQDDLSRTLYQVDESLDYIEEILVKFDAVMKAQGLIQN